MCRGFSWARRSSTWTLRMCCARQGVRCFLSSDRTDAHAHPRAFSRSSELAVRLHCRVEQGIVQPRLLADTKKFYVDTVYVVSSTGCVGCLPVLFDIFLRSLCSLPDRVRCLGVAGDVQEFGVLLCDELRCCPWSLQSLVRCLGVA